MTQPLPIDDPAWTHLENIGCVAKVDADGHTYNDAESLAASERLATILAEHGTENVRTGNAVPVTPGLIGVYVACRATGAQPSTEG